jgi:hypothetical protein
MISIYTPQRLSTRIRQHIQPHVLDFAGLAVNFIKPNVYNIILNGQLRWNTAQECVRRLGREARDLTTETFAPSAASGEISASICAVSLNDNPEYEALSYVHIGRPYNHSVNIFECQAFLRDTKSGAGPATIMID